MYSQDAFLTSILNYLSMPSSGALMISGSWGSGKTYYINYTLKDKLVKQGMYPIKISLFGLSTLDGLEKRIAETFLQQYGEEKLNTASEKEKGAMSRISRWLIEKKISKKTEEMCSVGDMIPFIGQYVDVSRMVDAYTSLCLRRLPINRIVLILDDLERAVKTIKPYLLLGAINDLSEAKGYKVIVIANDSYFNQGSKSYLDFKEKVIERTLLFPQDVITIYKGLIKQYETEYEKLMTDSKFVSIIDSDANVNKSSADLQENLSNIRILKFSITLFSKIYGAFTETIKAYPDNQDLKEFLLSLWALCVGLSIEYKRNRLTYLDRDAYIAASAIDSFVIDLDDTEQNPFETQELKENQKEFEKTTERIRDIFKKYIERHALPLIASVQVFDLVTAGIDVDNKLLNERWNEYRLNQERQKENPALALLNRFMMSIWTFTNEEFPKQLLQLAEYTKHGAFPNDVSYINVATLLQRYATSIEKSPEEIQAIITAGIDKHYEKIVKLSPISRTNLDIISTEIPTISRWVVDYIKAKVDNQADKERKDDIEEVVRQFNEDLPALAKRLTPDLSSHRTPDFFTFPILSKIPEVIIVEKLKAAQPNEVIAISAILNSRFIKRYTNVPFKEEAGFVLSLKKGIEARNKADKSLSSILIEDDLKPTLEKLLATIPTKPE